MQLRKQGSIASSGNKSRSPKPKLVNNSVREHSTYGSRISGSTAHKESTATVATKKKTAANLIEAQKEAQLVKQSMITARNFMKNEQHVSRAAVHGSERTEAASLVDRTNMQLSKNQSQFNSQANLHTRNTSGSHGKKYSNSMIFQKGKSSYNQNSQVSLRTYDNPSKKKKVKSPRQVQIEFVENEEVEKLRQEASEEKQSYKIQNMSNIVRQQQPILKLDTDLLRELNDFDPNQNKLNNTERAPLTKIQIEELDGKKFTNEYVEPKSATQTIKTGTRNDMNVDPASASIELFNSIFGEIFDQASIDKKTGRLYITKSQYEQAINMLADNNSTGRSQSSSGRRDATSEPDINEQRSHLLGLYKRADKDRLGIIFKDDLIQVLKDDLVRVYQQSEYQNDFDSMVSPPSGKWQPSKKSQIYGELDHLARNSTFREADSFALQSEAQSEIFEGRKLGPGASMRDETPKIIHNVSIKDQVPQQYQSPVSAELQTPNRKRRANRMTNKSKQFEQENGGGGVENLRQQASNKNPKPQSGIRLNDFQMTMSDKKQGSGSTEIMLKKNKQSTSSKKQNYMDNLRKSQEMHQFYISEQQPQRIQISQFLDMEIANAEENQERKKSSDEKVEQRNKLQKQVTTSSRPLSYKDLQRSTYLGALDLLNIQGRQQQVPSRQNDEMAEDSNFKPSSVVIQQSNLIFKEIFEPALGNQSFNSSLSAQRQIITKEKFDSAIMAYFSMEDDIQILRDLYTRSDMQNRGFVTKEQLIQAIQFDIQTSNQDSLTLNKTNQSTLEQDEASGKDDDVLQASPDTLKRKLMIEGKEITNPKQDPILLWLLHHELNKTATIDQRACQNLTQVIEYVNNYKLEQYYNSLPSLQFLFEILLQQSQRACKQYEDMQMQLEQMSQKAMAAGNAAGGKHTRQFDSFRDYAMKDMNAEVVKNLECEVDRLKAFEMMYHAQQRKLEQQVAENHELEIQRDNLQAVNHDLLHDYDSIKKEKEKCMAQRKKDAIQIKEMGALIENLKEQVLNNFKRASLDDEFTNDAESELQSSLSKLEDAESPLANIDIGRGNKAPLQPNRKFGQDGDEQDISMSDANNYQTLKANTKFATQLELQLLDDLETTEVFKMREQIQTYIRQHVWLEREGLKLQIKALNDNQRKHKKQLARRDMEIMNLKSEISTLKQLCHNQEERFTAATLDQDNLKTQLLELTKQHQKMNNEKSRLLGVNQILEQKLKVEKSEKMSMINDIEQMELQEELHGGGAGGPIDPNQSIVSGMSNLSRLSMKYSAQRGAGRMTSFIKQSKLNLSVRRTPHRGQRVQPKLPGTGRRETDRQSIGSQQALWIKNRVREETDFDQYSQFQENAMDNYDIDFSQMSAIKSRRDGDDQLELNSGRFNQSQSINMSHYNSQNGDSFDNRSSLIVKGAQGRQFMQSFRQSGDEEGARVQVISDFDSQDGDNDDKYSIEMTSQNDLARINENIKKIQISKAKNSNVNSMNYDLLGIGDENHKLHSKIEHLIEKEFQMKERRTQMAKSLGNGQGPIFSDKVFLYQNKKLRELILVILEGNIYLIQEREKDIAMQLKPFNFLDDITKIIYSERHTRYLALKLRDLRKFGDSDHVVIEIGNRELLADYMMEHAEKHEDDVVFELNEEFSMLVKYQPLWFSFDDVDRCRKQEQKMVFNSDKNAMTGFLELRQNKTMNILKSLFRGQQAIWERKYFVLRGFRLHVFAVQKRDSDYTKPERVLTLSEGLTFKEAKKADVGGKAYVITICADSRLPEDQQEIIHAACSGSQNLKKWMNSFKKVQELYAQADKIRQDLEMEKQIEKTLKDNEKSQEKNKQSRFTAPTNRNIMAKAKSKVADQKISSNGSSAVKDGDHSPPKAVHNAGKISEDFNAFAMEQIMMADGVTGSLRQNLEKRMEEGVPAEPQEESERAQEAYGAFGASKLNAQPREQAGIDFEPSFTAESEDPYEIIKKAPIQIEQPQQHKASTTDPVEQQPLPSNRERVRRGRGSRCSSRLNTSSKKEAADQSFNAGDEGGNQYCIDNINEEIKIGRSFAPTASDASNSNLRQSAPENQIKHDKSEKAQEKVGHPTSSILANKLINNPIGSTFKSKKSREDTTIADQLTIQKTKSKQSLFSQNSGIKPSQFRQLGSPTQSIQSQNVFNDRRKKYNKASEHISQQPLTKLLKDEQVASQPRKSAAILGPQMVVAGHEKKGKRNELSPQKQQIFKKW